MKVLTRVRGMVTTQRQRSDTARFPMNTFLAVLMSGDRRMVASTRQLPAHPTTYKYINIYKMCNKYYLILLYVMYLVNIYYFYHIISRDLVRQIYVLGLDSSGQCILLSR